MTTPLNLGQTPAHWLVSESPQKGQTNPNASAAKMGVSSSGVKDSSAKQFQKNKRSETPTKNLRNSLEKIQHPMYTNSSPVPAPTTSVLFESQPITFKHPMTSKSALLGSSSRPFTFYHGDRGILLASLSKVLNQRMFLFTVSSLFFDALFFAWPVSAANKGEFFPFVLSRIIHSILLYRLVSSRVDFSSDFIQVFWSLFSVWDMEPVALLTSILVCMLQQSGLYNFFITISFLPLETLQLVNSGSVRLAIILSFIMIAITFTLAVTYNPRLRRYRDMGVPNQGQWKDTLLWVIKKEHLVHAGFLTVLFSLLNAFLAFVLICGVPELTLELRATVCSAILKPLIFSTLLLFFIGVMQQYFRYAILAKVSVEKVGQSSHGIPLCFIIYSSNEMIGYSINNSFNAYVHYQCLSYISQNAEKITEDFFFSKKDQTTLGASDLWRTVLYRFLEYMDDFQRQLSQTSHLQGNSRLSLQRYEDLESWYDKIKKKIMQNSLERQMFLTSFRNLFFVKESLKILVKAFSFARATDRLRHLNCGNSLNAVIQKTEGIMYKLEEFREKRKRGFTSFKYELQGYDETFEELRMCRLQLTNAKSDQFL